MFLCSCPDELRIQLFVKFPSLGVTLFGNNMDSAIHPPHIFGDTAEREGSDETDPTSEIVSLRCDCSHGLQLTRFSVQEEANRSCQQQIQSPRFDGDQQPGQISRLHRQVRPEIS